MKDALLEIDMVDLGGKRIVQRELEGNNQCGYRSHMDTVIVDVGWGAVRCGAVAEHNAPTSANPISEELSVAST
jgi:hypothetical protein